MKSEWVTVVPGGSGKGRSGRSGLGAVALSGRGHRSTGGGAHSYAGPASVADRARRGLRRLASSVQQRETAISNSYPERLDVKEVFRGLDRDGDGLLDEREVTAVCGFLGIEASEAEVKELKRELALASKKEEECQEVSIRCERRWSE